VVRDGLHVGSDEDELRLAALLRRSECGSESVGVRGVVEWADGDDGREFGQPDQRAGGDCVYRREPSLDRPRLDLRCHLSSGLSAWEVTMAPTIARAGYLCRQR
jgi:hypothetical protein